MSGVGALLDLVEDTHRSVQTVSIEPLQPNGKNTVFVTRDVMSTAKSAIKEGDMTLVTKPPVTFKLYVGGMVYSGEPSYILGIVRYLQDHEATTQFSVTKVNEKLISIRALKAHAEKKTDGN